MNQIVRYDSFAIVMMIWSESGEWDPVPRLRATMTLQQLIGNAVFRAFLVSPASLQMMGDAFNVFVSRCVAHQHGITCNNTQTYTAVRAREIHTDATRLTSLYSMNTGVAHLLAAELPLRFSTLPQSVAKMRQDFEFSKWFETNLEALALGLAYDWGKHPLDWPYTFALTASTSKGVRDCAILNLLDRVIITRIANKFRRPDGTAHENDRDVGGTAL
jgi:hypothetical protein